MKTKQEQRIERQTQRVTDLTKSLDRLKANNAPHVHTEKALQLATKRLNTFKQGASNV